MSFENKQIMKIGIGGISRAGKTQLADLIRSLFTDRKTIVLCQDDFVFEQDKLPVIKDEIDWESPASIDFEKFRKAIITAGKEYDIVIAEGLLVFYDSGICAEFDKKLFVHINEAVFRDRKFKDSRWGSFPYWYVDHIWDSYRKYGRVERGRKDFLYLDGTQEFDREKILDFLSIQ